MNILAQDRVEELGSFTELKIFSGMEVTLVPADENRIVISGHSKDDVKFGITDQRLEIRLGIDHIWSRDNTEITVYGKSIHTLDANEGAMIEIAGELKQEDLTLRVQEGASIVARVQAKRIHAKAVTGGRITTEGKAEELEVEINTGGQFFGKELRTKNTVITAGTAGKGEVYASEYVKATAKLGGTIQIWGNPSEVDHKTSLGGKIL